MFDFVAKHKKAIMIGLFVLIIPPFAMFGIDSYFRGSDIGQSVAMVGDHRISAHEFNRALTERQDAVRQMMGGRADAALLDSPELRFSVIESQVRERILVDQALRLGITVTDQQLQSVLSEVPTFRDGDKFSYARYQEILRQQGMSPLMFENRMRQDMLTRQLAEVFSGSAFVSRTAAARLVRLSEQQREVSQFTIPADRFLAQVKLEPDAARKHYDGRQDDFRIPEQVRVEYVILSADALVQQATPNPEDVRKHYESRRAEYEVKETRQASHILIAAEASGPPEARKKALAAAQDIYEQVRKNPARFAELAKQHSQDPGSAEKGGDLGSFPRGTMVPAFENPVFSMKVGEISPPVESPFGYHVIRLTGVNAGQLQAFEQVRPQVEAELRKQIAARKFAESAEAFSNKAFEDSDSLKGAAQAAGAKIHQSGWLTRANAVERELNHPRVLQALFSDEVLKNKRNTEAIEVAPSTLLAARVVDHKPSTVRPFEEIKDALEKTLLQQRAGQLAAQDGRDRLAKLRGGQDAQVQWSAVQLVNRTDTKSLGEALLKQAFRVDATKLPAYAGVENPQGGYTLLRVSKVFEPEKPAVEKQNSLGDALRQLQGQEDFAAYVASLKQRVKVTIKQELIEKKDR